MELSFVSEQLANGKNYAVIARELGVTRQAVHDFCRRQNLKKPEKEQIISVYATKKAAFPYPEYFADANQRFRQKRQNAKYKKWEFTIEFENIVWPTHCPILGIKLEYNSSFDKKVESSISFDRIDSSKGYIPGNVQILSWRANRIKNDGTAEEHLLIANYMVSKL